VHNSGSRIDCSLEVWLARNRGLKKRVLAEAYSAGYQKVQRSKDQRVTAFLPQPSKGALKKVSQNQNNKFKKCNLQVRFRFMLQSLEK
jgi:hypothetical protein